MAEDLEPLSREDRLFTKGDDWSNNACLNSTADGWGTYSHGYKRAADLLIEHVERTSSDQNAVVYPALFLYRQYIELATKDITYTARRLLARAGGRPRGHDIRRLWADCRQLLIEVSPDEPVNDLDELTRLIAEFADVDPGAQAFRYPVDSRGRPSLEGMRLLNLRSITYVQRLLGHSNPSTLLSIYSWVTKGEADIATTEFETWLGEEARALYAA